LTPPETDTVAPSPGVRVTMTCGSGVCSSRARVITSRKWSGVFPAARIRPAKGMKMKPEPSTTTFSIRDALLPDPARSPPGMF
jgi:hypothetical protein